jgi:GNAT superfamily N-acetyltransferase
MDPLDGGRRRPPASEGELYYLHVPSALRPVQHAVEFLPVSQLLEDEAACKVLWELISSHFKTRSKFLAIWPCVRFVALYRHAGVLAGALLVSAPLNWQIDYVVVRPEQRGKGIAVALVSETLNQALTRKVPYVMLSSRRGLRPLYEGACGFSVVGGNGPGGPAPAALRSGDAAPGVSSPPLALAGPAATN